MSRQVLCEKCGIKKRLRIHNSSHQKASQYPFGVHQLYATSSKGPAEFARYVWGNARQPTKDQRVIKITSYATLGVERQQQIVNRPIDFYDCDLCGTPIHPGVFACCRSIWTEHQPEPPAWEHEYLIMQS